MTTPTPLPERIDTLADVAALDAAARLRTTRCGDGEMVWRAWGSGPPVVLLHGGAGSWTHWCRNIAALVDAGRTAWLPDLPGFGESASPPKGQDADAAMPWVAEGLQVLLGDARCDVVGFSFGSMVGTFLAAQHPARMRRLVLVGAPALSREPMAALDLRSWQRQPAGPAREAVHRHNLRTLMFGSEASIDALALALHAANIERDRMPLRRLSKTDVVVRTLPRIGCPLAGIWGADDALYRARPQTVAEALAQAPRFRTLVQLPDAGHWVQFEAAAAFDAALRAVLDRADDPADD